MQWRTVARLGLGRTASGLLLVFGVCLVGSCGSQSQKTGETPAPTEKECSAGEPCSGCTCPEGTECFSSSQPCVLKCPSGGDKAGEYYCEDSIERPCAEFLAGHAPNGISEHACTVCGCWDNLYCTSGGCLAHKQEGQTCTDPGECADACCRTSTSPAQSVCSKKAQCLLGVGEDCTNSDQCPKGGVCTKNGFCTAGCETEDECGRNSLTGENFCVADYKDYFPGIGGICLPTCPTTLKGGSRVNDCTHWATTCVGNLGGVWCTPVLP